ncbi:hypothetical protein GCM10028804_49600 [Larkinella terrae]
MSQKNRPLRDGFSIFTAVHDPDVNDNYIVADPDSNYSDKIAGGKTGKPLVAGALQ